MKTFYTKLLMLVVLALTVGTVSAQVDVTASAGTASQSYSTLSAAFGAINAGMHQGVITIGISASTTEPANTSDTLYSSGALSCNYTSIAIYPTTTGVTISGSPVQGRGNVELFGADNVTINGNLNNGTGTSRDLTFLSTTTNTVAFTGLIRLITSPTGTLLSTCNNVTVKNCILTGNVTSGNNSTITATTSASWCNWGIYVGGDSSSTSVQATKIARVAAAVASMSSVAGGAVVTSTADNLVFDNNKINQTGRAIAFNGNGNNALASSSVTITNNVIGSDIALSDYNAGTATNAVYPTTVYAKGIFVTGSCNALTITGNTVKNIASYLTSGISGIEVGSGVGATGSFSISNNTVTNVYNNNGTSGGVNGIVINTSSTGGTTPLISTNTVTNIQSAAPAVNSGISLTSVVGTVVDKNVIKTVYNRNATTGSQAVGIKISFNGNIITNNRISDVLFGGGAASFTVSGAGAFGIYASTGTNTKFYHNSVYLSGSLFATNTSSHITAAFAITATSCTGNDVRNNIFVNTITGGTTSLAHVAVYLPSAATVSMALTMNNNAYYCGTTSASQGVAQVGITAGTGYYAAANFNAGPAAPGATNFRVYTSTLSAAGTNDNASFANNSGTSPFTSDLHTSVSGATQLESGGASATITGITTDIDGDTRPNGAAPDMGADEFTGTALDVTPPVISYTAVSFDCDATNSASRVISGITISDPSGVATGTLSPRVYYKKGVNGTYTSSQGSLSGGLWNFTITYTGLGMTNGDSIYYFFVAQDAVGNVGTSNSGGVFTDVNTYSSAYPPVPSFYRAASMSGTYNVGAGFTAPGFTTIGAAIKTYNSSCLTGAVTFSLIGNSYSETSDTILANSTASATNTLTIKPTQANTVILGNSGASNAVFLLRGADYVTINGSISSTTNSICNGTRASRDLTIKNAYTAFNSGATGSAVIWLGTDATGTDAPTNNKIINCNVTGVFTSGGNGIMQQCGIGSGGATPSISTNGTATSAGNGNNNNQFINDSISTCQMGVYTYGASAGNKNTGTVISMIITGKTPNNVSRGGISVNFEDGVQITGNKINALDASLAAYPSAMFGIALGYGPGSSSLLTTQTSGNEVTNATVSKNVIDSIYNVVASGSLGSALVGLYLANGSSGTTTISNNRISNFTAFASFGNGTDLTSALHICGGAGTVNVYNNTISLTNGTSISSGNSGFTGTEACYGFSIANNSPVVNFKNNIINASAAVYTNRNRAIGLGYALPANNLTSNNNDLFASVGTGASASTNAAAIAQTGDLRNSLGTLHSTLANWQTNSGKDANSLNVAPVFLAANDLHLASSGNCSLIGAGAAGLVSDDIDCQTRTSNDIGADEGSSASISIATSTTTICAGASTTFTATASNATSPTYQWNKNGNSISGANSATYSSTTLANNDAITCILTSSSCNPVSNAISMTVNAIVTPNLSISTTSGSSICSSNTLTITANSSTGGSSPSFEWFKNGQSQGTGNGTITFGANTLSAGNNSFSCVMTANNLCQTTATASSTSIVIQVKQSPLIGISTVGQSTLCGVNSKTTAYNSNTNGGGVWSSNSTAVSVTTSGGAIGTVTAIVSSGFDTLTYTKTATNGCVVKATVPVAVTTSVPGTITGNNSVCRGSTTTLGGVSGGTWSTPSSSIASVNSGGVVTGNSAGNATIVYTVSNSNGCNAISTRNVTVNPTPATPAVSYLVNKYYQAGAGGAYCIGDTFTVIAKVSGALVSGNWQSSNTAIATIGATSGLMSIVGTGGGASTTITFTYTSPSGCISSRAIPGVKAVVLCPVHRGGVSNEVLLTSSKDFILYPNPARSTVSLQVEKLVGSGTIVVTDLYGKQVKVQALSMGTNTIDISNLAKGFYLVSTITEQGKTTKKLVVE